MSLEGGWVEIPIELFGNKGSWRIYWDSKFGKKLIELHETGVKIIEAVSGGSGAQAKGASLSLIAHGTGITGDVEDNTITGGTITAFTLQTRGKEGMSSTRITGFEPQDATTFFDNMKSLNTDYAYAMTLLAGDTVASVRKGAPGGGFFDTGAGNDTVTGGAGNDISLKWQSGDFDYDGGKGRDLLDFSSLDFTTTPPSNAAVDLMKGTGLNPYGGTLTLKNVEDVNGAFGASNDIRGSGGGNRLQGGTLADTLMGRAGDDEIYVKYATTLDPRATVADGGAGRDRLVAELSDSSAAPFTGSGETLRFHNTLDLLNPEANTGTFHGATFRNFEIFQSKASAMGIYYQFEFHGSDKAEKASGWASEDTLDGRGGNDTLFGGYGGDDLTGGGGADLFQYRYDSDSTVDAVGSDRITDFSRQQHDRIDLHLIENGGKNGKFDFIGTEAFSGKGSEIRYEKSSGDTLVSVDLDGDKQPDMAILLDDGPAKLLAGDFFL